MNTAVVVNVLIFGAKVAVWMVTRSGSLLAEAVHSMADIGNQLLLRAGVQQSRRMPTRQHPYGYGREKYIFSLMSAVGMFCVGAGAAVVHGVQSILDPPALEHMGYNLAGELKCILLILMHALARLRSSSSAIHQPVSIVMFGCVCILRTGYESCPAPRYQVDFMCFCSAFLLCSPSSVWVCGDVVPARGPERYQARG